MADDRRVGDFGQLISIGVTGIDATTADTVQIFTRRPDDTLIEWVPTSIAPTLVTYQIQSGDLTVPGVYRGELRLTMLAGAQYTTTKFILSVGDHV